MFGWIKRLFVRRRNSPLPPPLFVEGDAMWNGVPVRTMTVVDVKQSHATRIALRQALIRDLDQKIDKAVKAKKPRKGMMEERIRLKAEIMEIEQKMGGV